MLTTTVFSSLSARRWLLGVVCVTAHVLVLPSALAESSDPMAQRTLACTNCHGPQGKSGPDGYYPRLAGKPSGYLYNQLRNIHDGRRQYAPMQGLLATLNDAYLREIAEYFSSLDVPYPPPVARRADAAVLARGQTLAVQGDRALQLPACAQCHGTALTGVQPHTPGLLGLPRDYLNAQLGGWQTGQRKAQAPDCMAHIAKGLSDADVHAVTTWLAGQTVPKASRAVAQRPALTPGASAIECGSAP